MFFLFSLPCNQHLDVVDGGGRHLLFDVYCTTVSYRIGCIIMMMMIYSWWDTHLSFDNQLFFFFYFGTRTRNWHLPAGICQTLDDKTMDVYYGGSLSFFSPKRRIGKREREESRRPWRQLSAATTAAVSLIKVARGRERERDIVCVLVCWNGHRSFVRWWWSG